MRKWLVDEMSCRRRESWAARTKEVRREKVRREYGSLLLSLMA